MEKTLSGEYFTILSVLYTCKEGMEIVEAIRIFTLFYRLSESKSREDLIKSMITSLDYSVYVFVVKNS
jgi:hypothetical protein